jgi:hypothetical protein
MRAYSRVLAIERSMRQPRSAVRLFVCSFVRLFVFVLFVSQFSLVVCLFNLVVCCCLLLFVCCLSVSAAAVFVVNALMVVLLN